MPRGQLTLRVYLDGHEPYEVSTRLVDHNQWDTTRARHKWPSTQDAPITWLGFMAWAASRRTGQSDLTWEEFLAACEAVENVDGEDVEDITPTIAAPGLALPAS